jgi:hypothetical protein
MTSKQQKYRHKYRHNLFATPSKSLSRKYEQLNVNKRREAVDKAKKIGIL